MVEPNSIQNWVTISSTMIGVTLTILTLVLTFLVPQDPNFDMLGRRLIVYLLLAAFILFVNAVTTNSRVLYELTRDAEESFINTWIKFAEFSFGLGFTLIIVTFALTSYIYVDILAATILMTVAWIIMFIYTFLNDPLDTSLFAALRSAKRNLWFIMEVVSLIFLYVDELDIIGWVEVTIPF